jgi:hypothetical protein
MKPRTPGTIEDALTILCAGIGFADAAQVVGRSEQHVRRWTDPDDVSLPNIKQAAQLDAEHIRKTGEAMLTPLLVKWMEALCKRAKKKEAECLPTSLMDVTAQIGLLAGCVRDAAEDGKVCRQERDQLLRHVANLRKEIDDMDHAIWAAHKKSAL